MLNVLAIQVSSNEFKVFGRTANKKWLASETLTVREFANYCVVRNVDEDDDDDDDDDNNNNNSKASLKI